MTSSALIFELLDRQTSRCGKCGITLHENSGKIRRLVPEHYQIADMDQLDLLSSSANAVLLCKSCVTHDYPYDPNIQIVFIGEARQRERLLAKPLGQRRYKILATPILTPGISLSDIVTCTLIGKNFVFKSVLKQSGLVAIHLRVLQADKANHYSQKLKSLGCLVTAVESNWIGVSFGAESDVIVIKKIIFEAEDAGIWQWGILNDPLERFSL